MQLKVADLSDIDDVLELHYRYQVDSIDEQDKADGFVTTPFTKEQLTSLIRDERGLFLATDNGRTAAYLMAASWHYWSSWPMFAYMINELSDLEFLGRVLTVDNSYQYGPVCIDKPHRGSGVLEKLFDFATEQMSARYPILVTFINKNNPRSYAAHTRKLGLLPLREFTYNGNAYYELVYDTSRKLL